MTHRHHDDCTVQEIHRYPDECMVSKEIPVRAVSCIATRPSPDDVPLSIQQLVDERYKLTERIWELERELRAIKSGEEKP